MESNITVLRGLSKRIEALLVFDETYVTQLDSISQTIIQQINNENNIMLLDIIAKGVYKLLLLARVNYNLGDSSRVRLVQIMKKCVEKLRTLSASIDSSSVVFPHIKSCSEKDLRVKSFLLQEVCASLISFGCMEISAVTAEEALSCLNYTLTGVSRSERLALSDCCKSELLDLANFLIHCGDYSLQEVIMETFTRMTPQTSRESGCHAWFGNFPPEAQQAFIGFGKVVFQVELRPFLNAVNGMWKTGVHTLTCNKMMLGELEMHNPESKYLPKFYVDFSKGSQIISFCGVQDKGPFENNGNPLIFVKILNEDIKSSVMISTKKPNYHQLTIILENPLEMLFNSKYHCETVIIMIIKAYDIKIVKSVLGEKFEADLSKVSSQMDSDRDDDYSIGSKDSNKRVLEEPRFYMFQYPDDNLSASTEVAELENHSPEETNAKTGARLATPMNFAPVRVDRSPGKSTFADYVTVADSDEDLKELEWAGRKATPAAKKNVMPSKATPVAQINVKQKGTLAFMNDGKLFARSLTPGALQVQLKGLKLYADTPAADLHLKGSYSPSPTAVDEISDNSEEPNINKSKKCVGTPVVKAKAKHQYTPAVKTQKQKQLDDGHPDKQPRKVGRPRKQKSAKEVVDKYEPLAKRPQRQPRKVKAPVKPRAERPDKTCAKPESEQAEPRVPVRKSQPRKSCVENASEAAGNESESDNDFSEMIRNLKKRRMLSKEDNKTELTMATYEDFDKPAINMKRLPHDDFVMNFKLKQQATCKGQKEATYNKTSDSSKETTFDTQMKTIPRPKTEEKCLSPEVAKEMKVKEPKLFGKFDFDLQVGLDRMTFKHLKIPKDQNKPWVGNKVDPKLEKSVPTKETIKKRTMKEESNKKPAQKVLKSNTAAIKMESKINQEDLTEKSLHEDIIEVSPAKEDEFLKMPVKRCRSFKLKLISKQHLDAKRVEKLLEQERSTCSDNEECKFIGKKVNPKNNLPIPDSSRKYFEDLFCNSGDLDKVTVPSPTPKKKLRPTKKVSETSDEEQQPRKFITCKSKHFKATLKKFVQADAKATRFLQAQQAEDEAKLVARTNLNEAKSKLARAKKEPEAEFARAQQEKAKLMLHLMPEKKDKAKRVPITEETDVASKKIKLKLCCPSDKDTEKDDSCKKRSGQTLNMFHKFQLKRRQPIDEDESDGTFTADKSALSMESKVKTAKCETPKKNTEDERKKKPLAKQPVETRSRKKQPQPETSEEELDEYEEKAAKPSKKNVMISPAKPESKQQNASSSNTTTTKMDHHEKLLVKLQELHQMFNQREIRAKNLYRLEVVLNMKEELRVALKKEKHDLAELNGHLQLTKEIIDALLKEFDLSGLTDNTAHVTELVEQLVKITESFFDPKDLEKLAKRVLSERQKVFYKDVHTSVCSVLALFKRT